MRTGKKSILWTMMKWLILMTSLFSCTDQNSRGKTAKKSVLSVKAPVEKLNPTYHNFILDALTGGTFQLPNGTEIYIPGKSICDHQGQLVEGEVKILYREFHDAVDIVLAGIPMNYGADQYMETAGMFELRAEQNGQPLQVAKGKKIEVHLASYVAEDLYQQYYFNESQGKWEAKGPDKIRKNPRRIALQEKIKNSKTSIQVPLNDQYFIFRYESALDVQYEINREKVAEREVMERRFKKYGLRWPGIYSSMMMEYKGKWMPAALMVWKITSGKFPADAKDANARLTLEKNKSYEMKLTTYVNDKPVELATMNVVPVMSLQELMGKSADQWISQYTASVQEKATLEKNIELMAELQRSFFIDQFGIYNCDQLYSDTTAAVAKVDFKWKDEHPEEKFRYYYVSGSGRSVITYYTAKEPISTRLIEDDKAFLFAFLPGQRIAVYRREKYKAIDFASLRAHPNALLRVEMETLPGRFNSAEEIREAFGI